MTAVLLACEATPLWVAAAFTAWGALLWFTGVRKLWRDPAGEIRRIAELRARSRLLHPLGGGDVDEELRTQWRYRWIAPVAVIGYAVGVVGLWVSALWC